MKNYAGLDVSLKSIFICIVNEEGKVVKEKELSCSPEVISGFLMGTGLEITRIGLESGCLTHWLTKSLREHGFTVIPMEARKMAAILATTINKTDENDARGIAEALRAGYYKECVHRSNEAMVARTVLHCRGTLVRERTHLVCSLKGHLKVYGIKLKKGQGEDFAKEVMESIKELDNEVKKSIKSLLRCLKILNKEIVDFDKQIKKKVKNDDDIKLLKSIDGVGDITASVFKSEIDDPQRFANSRDVGAYLGLTPRLYSSGEIHRQGRISKHGSKEVRYLLVEAANALLTRCKSWSKLKAFGMRIWKRSGKKKAQVAVARKLAVMMHSMLLSRDKFERKGEKQKATNCSKIKTAA